MQILTGGLQLLQGPDGFPVNPLLAGQGIVIIGGEYFIPHIGGFKCLVEIKKASADRQTRRRQPIVQRLKVKNCAGSRSRSWRKYRRRFPGRIFFEGVFPGRVALLLFRRHFLLWALPGRVLLQTSIGHCSGPQNDRIKRMNSFFIFLSFK
jgi:hypothetical protein